MIIKKEKFNQELQRTKDKLNTLLDLHLDGDIDIEGYKEKKNKLIDQKANLEAQITKISEEGNLWLKPTLSFLKSCNQANKFIEGNNFTEMNKFVQKAGSNRKITKQKLAIHFLGPFNQLSELRQLPMMCSSTADNHSSVFSETQSEGGWEYKKRSRRRPTDLGLGVAEPSKASRRQEAPGTDVSGFGDCESQPVTADMAVRTDSEVSRVKWCPG